MTSFNHYALGAVADWLHRTVGGIAPGEPGYRQIAIRPRPGGGLSHASTRHLTPYGLAECTWRIKDGTIEIDVLIPPNARGTVSLPGREAEPVKVESGRHNWSYTYVDPDARQPLSIENSVGEFLDDPDAWTAVIETLARLIPQNVFVENMLKSQSRRSLRLALAMLPNADEVQMAVAEALAAH
jgi:alpha-L-rhamnosidase